MTADAVRAAAKTWLNSRSSVTGYLVNNAPAPRRSTREANADFVPPVCTRRIWRGVALLLFGTPVSATTIERVVSPAVSKPGWCTSRRCRSSRSDVAFAGGTTQDPPGKAGTANLVASLLDEGAGDLDSNAFHARLERKAIELGFSARIATPCAARCAR